MFVIGLTGGIASGKSTVSRKLAELGATIVDADVIAREIVMPGLPAWEDIKNNFGEEVLLADGQLDRKKLGQLVFIDPSKLELLNNITHPRIKVEIETRLQKLAAENKVQVAVVDAALLIEARWHTFVDEVWLVQVDRETQLQRLMMRDGMTREQAVDRIESQMPLAEKAKFAQRIVDNNGTIEETKQQVEFLYRAII